MQMASIIVCVDDTDDETRSTSTGKVAELIANRVVELGGRVRLGITRHQLLLSEDVPYTSHNSSMAFEALVPEDCLDGFRSDAVKTLVAECVAASDPGLAIAVIPALDEIDDVVSQQVSDLIAFGNRAKQVYCPKDSAYAVASAIPWVSLSEHGGDGQGVVGALAGVGLRLSGSDGRFRGKWDLGQVLEGDHARSPGSGAGSGSGSGSGKGSGQGRRKEKSRGDDNRVGDAACVYAPAGEIVAKLAQRADGPVRMVDEAGSVLPPDVLVLCGGKVKPVFLGGSLTVVCRMQDGQAIPLSKDQLGDAADDEALSGVCAGFEWDNDAEECAGKLETCRNCLHRRWERWGFSCMLGSFEGNVE